MSEDFRLPVTLEVKREMNEWGFEIQGKTFIIFCEESFKNRYEAARAGRNFIERLNKLKLTIEKETEFQ